MVVISFIHSFILFVVVVVVLCENMRPLMVRVSYVFFIVFSSAYRYSIEWLCLLGLLERYDGAKIFWCIYDGNYIMRHDNSSVNKGTNTAFTLASAVLFRFRTFQQNLSSPRSHCHEKSN